jgi:dihydrofolate reductase
MGRLVVSTQLTVDGVITTDKWFIPEGEHAEVGFGLLTRAEALLLGRKTFAGLAEYWAPINGDRWADEVNPRPKFVASRTLTEPLPWNATLITGEVADGVAKLKAELDGDLLMYGCGGLARHLVGHGLVDEICFWMHPTVWGPGERPFHEGDPVPLRLMSATPYESGVTLLRYQPGYQPDYQPGNQPAVPGPEA